MMGKLCKEAHWVQQWYRYAIIQSLRWFVKRNKFNDFSRRHVVERKRKEEDSDWVESKVVLKRFRLKKVQNVVYSFNPRSFQLICFEDKINRCDILSLESRDWEPKVLISPASYKHKHFFTNLHRLHHIFNSFHVDKRPLLASTHTTRFYNPRCAKFSLPTPVPVTS